MLMKRFSFNLISVLVIVTILFVSFVGISVATTTPTNGEKLFDTGCAYKIVNLANGHGLLTGYWGHEDATNVDQYEIDIDNADNPDAFKWELKLVDDGYHIINKANGHGLLTGYWGAEGATNVDQYEIDIDNANNPDAFIWNFEEYDELDCSTKLKLNIGTNQENIGDINRLTSLTEIPKKESEHVIIGETLIPFFAVNDPDYQSPAMQLKDNPYYIFRREGYWTRAYYFVHHGETNVEEKQVTTIGLIQSETHSIERTTGFEVTASASVSYGGAGASVSSTFYSELKVTQSESTTEERIETKEITKTYDVGNEIAETVWYRVDEYTLLNLDGRVISQSIWVDDTQKMTDAFPDFEPTPTPTSSPSVSPTPSPTPEPSPDSGFNLSFESVGVGIAIIAVVGAVIFLLKRK